MTDGGGTTSYSYDDSNRVTSATRGSSEIAYTYNSAGQLASRTYPSGAGSTSYAYDSDGQLHTAVTSGGTTSYGYDANGDLTSTAYPNGWTETRAYDNAGRVADINSSKGSQTLAAADYILDADGNPTHILRDGNDEYYSYDSAGRVTAVCYGHTITGCRPDHLHLQQPRRPTQQVSAGTQTDYTSNNADQLTNATIQGGASTDY